MSRSPEAALPHSDQPNPPIRKKRRRHTRTHIETLRPIIPDLPLHSMSNCPKCQGLLHIGGGETMSERIMRCLNCGWQPHHRISIVEEPEEARTLRHTAVQIGCQDRDHYRFIKGQCDR